MNCLICYDAKMLVKPGNCEHQYCKQCIQLYLKDTINNGGVHLITCPGCKSEYNALVIKQYCFTLYDKYLELKEKAIIRCSACKEDIKKHKCKANVCLKCGEQHQGQCSQRCPNCLIPIEKISGCNHMVCKCKYEFCWLCTGKFTRYHYRLWNLCGCPIPGSMMRSMQPLKYPNLIRILMILPKILASLIVITLLIIVYPLYCMFLTVQFHYRQFKFHNIRILLVLLLPLTYLLHLFYYGIFQFQKKLLSLR